MDFSKITTFLQKKLVPQLDEAISQREDAIRLTAEILKKSGKVLPLFDKLKKLSYDYTNAAASGDISNEEAQTLIADIKIIANDPAVTELQKLIEGYACSDN